MAVHIEYETELSLGIDAEKSSSTLLTLPLRNMTALMRRMSMSFLQIILPLRPLTRITGIWKSRRMFCRFR